MVVVFGVSTFLNSLKYFVPSTSAGSSTETAWFAFAAYPQFLFLQKKTSFSPALFSVSSIKTIYSCETAPPIAPESD